MNKQELASVEDQDFNRVLVGNDDVRAFNFFLTGKADLEPQPVLPQIKAPSQSPKRLS